MQKLAEFARLLELVDGTRAVAGRLEERVRVLEIGSYKGGTLAGFRHMWPDAYIVAVDQPDPPDRVLRSYSARVVEADSHLPATRNRVEELLAVTNPPGAATGVDLCFVDGDHSLEGVRLDVSMYGGFVRPGGLLALHDIVPYNEGKSPPMGPDLFWQSVKAGDEHLEWWGAPDIAFRPLAEIIDEMPQVDGRGPWWGGIAVLERIR